MSTPQNTQISIFRHVRLEASKLALPLDWDPHTDVTLLMGEGLEDYARWILEAGAQRVVLRVPDGAPLPELEGPILLADNDDQLHSALMAYPEPMPRNFMVVTSATWPDAQEYERLMPWLDNLLTAKAIFHNTVDSIGPVLMEQGMRNIPMIAAHPSVASLRGVFQGKPAVIVSPGPSLSKNIHLLKELKGKAVLITGTHSLAAFKSAGVHPDLVLAVDVGNLNTHYDDYDMRGVEALILGNTTQRMHFEQPAQRILTLPANKNSDEWFYRAFDEHVDLHTGGSVACTAMSLAELMGCSPILLVGQDLSFPGDKYYADECVHGSVQVVETATGAYLKADEHLIDGMQENQAGHLCFALEVATLEVPGYHGGMVRTSKSLRGFLWWFENFIKHRSQLGPIWNCTEGGARIEGAEQLELAQALEKLADVETDVPALLNACLADHDVGFRSSALLEHFGEIQDVLKLCCMLAERCRETVPLAAADAWSMKRLEGLEARLTEATASVRCLAVLSQREITATLAEARQAPDLSRSLAASLRLYDIIRRGSEFLLGPLGDGLEELSQMHSLDSRATTCK